MLTVLLISSLASAFAILFIGRWQYHGASIREWCIVHSTRLVSEMFSCDFCLSFWTNLCVCLILAPCLGLWWPPLCAPLATPVTRLLIR